MAITTTYRGIEYRSRLEARWAAFFTGLGWHYTYEPFDGDGYIPDFLIHGARPMLVEVKPAVGLSDYTAAVAKAENGLRDWSSDILIVGADPLPLLEDSGPTGLAAGLLGEIVGEGEWAWASACWLKCLECHEFAVMHSDMSYTARPCGHGEGDHLIGPPQRGQIADAWANACNDVKWRGRNTEQPSGVVPPAMPSVAPQPRFTLPEVRHLWPDVVEATKQQHFLVWMYLSSHAQVIGIEGNTLILGFDNSGTRDSFVNGGCAKTLSQTAKDVLGVNWKVDALVDPGAVA